MHERRNCVLYRQMSFFVYFLPVIVLYAVGTGGNDEKEE